MKRLWKAGLAVVAFLALGVTAVGFVAAQTDSEVPTPQTGVLGDFVGKLAENLGISQDELEAAIDETQLEIVDDAVAQDRLTEEQADRIRERIESGEGMFPFGGFGKGFAMGRGMCDLGAHLDDLAEFIGISADDLRAALVDGQSLTQVAEANGVSRDDLVGYLVGEVETRVAQAVEDGKIDQARADEILANATERIEQMVDQEGLPDAFGPWGGGHHRGGGFGMPFAPESEPTPEGAGTSF